MVVQGVYASFFKGALSPPDRDLLMFQAKVTRKNAFDVMEKIEKIAQVASDLEEKIRPIALSYPLQRISPVEKAVLMVMLYEILYEDLPVAVGIDEAIRLIGTFSHEGSQPFVHAIIDHVCAKKE
ncbi:MAG: hypothetical protein A3F09_02535 [Chlamydiae bacterium RIFCSPHIGHO2_12_FULL_49_11]|nr:MAG: hypothetical protein A3F09_02535 [Chlamydiae bacterium RIFCSPHIGHO2_12_FULL_49_11]